MYYEIYRNYTTGNSFGSSDEFGTIGLVWQDESLAIKAFEAISQHYNLYLHLESSQYRQSYRRHSPSAYAEQDLMLRYYAISQYWCEHGIRVFSEQYSDVDINLLCMWYFYFAVEVTPGEYRRIDIADHCGYFERLNSLVLVQVARDAEVTVHYNELVESELVVLIQKTDFC